MSLRLSYWNGASHTLKVTSPIVTMLRLKDGGKHPTMNYIYDDMDRKKEGIIATFGRDEKTYEKVFFIIDDKWRC